MNMNYSYNQRTTTEYVGVNKNAPNGAERSLWMEGLTPSGWAPRAASRRTSLLGVGAGGFFQCEATQDSEYSRDKDKGPEVHEGNAECSVTAE